MDNNDIVVITGGFDPIHSGHIAYINAAAKLGRVVVGVNSDEWLTRKKGAPSKLLGYRFSKDIIDELIDIKWWDLEDSIILDIVPLLHQEMNLKVIEDIKNIIKK